MTLLVYMCTYIPIFGRRCQSRCLLLQQVKRLLPGSYYGERMSLRREGIDNDICIYVPSWERGWMNAEN